MTLDQAIGIVLISFFLPMFVPVAGGPFEKFAEYIIYVASTAMVLIGILLLVGAF